MNTAAAGSGEQFAYVARHGDGTPVDVLADVIRRRAALSPDAIAVVASHGTATFAELDSASNQVANALIADGCVDGERVVFLGPNGLPFLHTAYGAMKAGAIFTPLNTRLSPGELGEIVRLAEPHVVVIEQASTQVIDAISDVVGAGVRLILGEDEFASWQQAADESDPRRDASPERTVLIMFSSGTTGRPKGVMLSSVNLASGLYLMNQLVELDESSVCSAPVPFFHVSGLGLALVATLNGARLLLERPGQTAQLLNFMVENRVSHANVVPTVIESLINQPGAAAADFSAWRYVLYGAAPMPVPLLEQATEVFGCKFLQSYGLTESTGGFTILSAEDHVDGRRHPHRLASVGRVVPGTRVRIVNPDTLADVPLGSHGEVLVAGPRVMNGYWRESDQTRAAIIEGGWLRTGDGGSFDADGYLYLHERIKDMIVSGGENIYPAEIEAVIAQHPSVVECAVVAVGSKRWANPRGRSPSSPWARLSPRTSC